MPSSGLHKHCMHTYIQENTKNKINKIKSQKKMWKVSSFRLCTICINEISIIYQYTSLPREKHQPCWWTKGYNIIWRVFWEKLRATGNWKPSSTTQAALCENSVNKYLGNAQNKTSHRGCIQCGPLNTSDTEQFLKVIRLFVLFTLLQWFLT